MKPTKSTKRRTSTILVVVLLGVCLVVYKLIDIQVVSAGALAAQAAAARGSVDTIYAPRGDIVADDGTVLAGSVLRYDFQADPSHTADFQLTDSAGHATTVTVAQALEELANATGGSAAKFQAAITAALKANPDSLYALLYSNADVAAYNRVIALKIPWVHATSHPGRVYPDGAVAGNIIGYLNAQGVGVEGLESAYQQCLAGVDGKESYQYGADGVVIPGSTQVTKAAKPGGTLVTTLDADLNWFANQQLVDQVAKTGAEFGQIAVIDTKTGAIKASAQYPSVDPNNVDGTPAAYRSTAMMFSSQFEPGSIFKAISAAAMIDSGYATPSSRVIAPYAFTAPGGVLVHDAEGHGDSRLTLTGILMNSSNTGISSLGANMDPMVRYAYYQKFGIGTATGVDFPAESSGVLTNPSTWSPQTKFSTLFGQGVSATQAQMLDAYQALANGGVRIPLTLVKGCRQADGAVTDAPKPKPVRVVSKKSAQTVLDMLESIVQQGPYRNTLRMAGYRYSAKTGTAQEPNPNGSGYFAGKYYVSVMGVTTTDDPRYVISVNLGYPTTNRTSAAAIPLFKIMVQQVLKTFHIAPSSSVPTMYQPYW